MSMCMKMHLEVFLQGIEVLLVFLGLVLLLDFLIFEFQLSEPEQPIYDD